GETATRCGQRATALRRWRRTLDVPRRARRPVEAIVEGDPEAPGRRALLVVQQGLVVAKERLRVEGDAGDSPRWAVAERDSRNPERGEREKGAGFSFSAARRRLRQDGGAGGAGRSSSRRRARPGTPCRRRRRRARGSRRGRRTRRRRATSGCRRSPAASQ